MTASGQRQAPSVPDFWRLSGYHLLERTTDGRLAISGDFLGAYLRRPEMMPVAESCAAERALHAALIDDPLAPVEKNELAQLADPDVVENFAIWLSFRDALLAAGSLEAAYLQFVRQPSMRIPPLFLDQMAHAILRNALDGCAEPRRLRAAELLFRTQKVNIVDGSIMLADEETVNMQSAVAAGGALMETPTSQPTEVELDVLSDATQQTYWQRSDRFDMVFDASLAKFGQDALSRVLEAWIDHLLGVQVSIQPVASIRDQRWRWHVGLDAEASGLLNALYNGLSLDDEDLYRLLGLFRLEFKEPAVVLEDVRGRPVYLGMAMTPDGRLRLKPQNLIVNLPLQERV